MFTTGWTTAALCGFLFLVAPLELPAQDLRDAVAIDREVQRIARSRQLWPGFDPLSIPLAIYTGGQTYLFRHPSPPEGFTRLAGSDVTVFGMSGRHPAVTSNSSADIGGVSTGTLLADGRRAAITPTVLAAVALHEAFHVFQRQRHSGWGSNEADLFRYPTEEAGLLALRRLESEALSRSLRARKRSQVACWAREAIAVRRQRFAALDSAFSGYEQGNELNEGLAAYIQLLAEGRTTIEFPPDEFPAIAVRDRIYTVGPALAFTLDRLAPGWQDTLETNDRQPIDVLLERALARIDSTAPGSCGFTAEERAAIERTAQADAAAVAANRVERRRVFEARSGWRVIVQAAEGRPLWPKGFDPLNVETVEGGILHRRFLQLGNDSGELRVIDEKEADGETLTVAAGAHPLFNGVNLAAVAGLPRPEITESPGGVQVRGPGIQAAFSNATVTVQGTTIRIQLR